MSADRGKPCPRNLSRTSKGHNKSSLENNFWFGSFHLSGCLHLLAPACTCLRLLTPLHPHHYEAGFAASWSSRGLGPEAWISHASRIPSTKQWRQNEMNAWILFPWKFSKIMEDPRPHCHGHRLMYLWILWIISDSTDELAWFKI